MTWAQAASNIVASIVWLLFFVVLVQGCTGNLWLSATALHFNDQSDYSPFNGIEEGTARTRK